MARSPVGRTASNGIGLSEAEVIRRRGPWRNLEAAESATLDRADRHDHRRLFEPIGNMPPAEAEARYCAQLEPAAMAAGSSQPASGEPGAVQPPRH